MNSGEDVVDAFAAMTQLRREVVVACAVDRRSRLVAWNLVAASANDQGLHHVGGVFASAITASGVGVVLLRNSRTPEPRTSQEEFAFIRKASEAAHVLGFALLDYIVLSASAWASLLERPVVEPFARIVNLTPAQRQASGRDNVRWKCRVCQKPNQKQIPIFPSIFGTYTPAHCDKCRAFAWLLPT